MSKGLCCGLERVILSSGGNDMSVNVDMVVANDYAMAHVSLIRPGAFRRKIERLKTVFSIG